MSMEMSCANKLETCAVFVVISPKRPIASGTRRHTIRRCENHPLEHGAHPSKPAKQHMHFARDTAQRSAAPPRVRHHPGRLTCSQHQQDSYSIRFEDLFSPCRSAQFKSLSRNISPSTVHMTCLKDRFKQISFYICLISENCRLHNLSKFLTRANFSPLL